MTRPVPANLPASVRQRLLNLARKSSEDFNLILTWYAAEHLLYRLTRSPFAPQFALKGAMLFTIWAGRPHRPTRDVNLLGYGEDSVARVADIFRSVAQMDVVPDGLTFDADASNVSDIRDEQEYGGKRVELLAMLGTARISVRVDIGFGDAITPEAQEAEYPSLLAMPASRIRAYPRETVVAEKVRAMVVLGMLNSRLKDFYDLFVLAEEFSFDGLVLSRALVATFSRRRTALPTGVPVGLTNEFGANAEKVVQWQAFLGRNRLQARVFSDVVATLNRFLLPIFTAATQNIDFKLRWEPGSSWR